MCLYLTGLLRNLLDINIQIFVGITFALYGNHLYQNHVNKGLSEAYKLDESKRERFIIKKGGTSNWLIFIYSILVGFSVLRRFNILP